MYCVYRRYVIQQSVNNYRRYSYYKKGRALFALCLFLSFLPVTFSLFFRYMA
nr:MAG TPA: hypothetical protein [Siphoviridae sp. ctgbm9]